MEIITATREGGLPSQRSEGGARQPKHPVERLRVLLSPAAEMQAKREMGRTGSTFIPSESTSSLTSTL